MTEELRKTVALSLVKDMGPVGFKGLIEKYKNVSAVFRATEKELRGLKAIKRINVGEIKDPRLFEKADLEIEKAVKNGVNIVGYFGEDYPEALRAIYDPPIVLYVKGQLPKSFVPAVAVVGSRGCSHYGKNMAHQISKELARHGVAVVSGLALGIDSAAHEGALDGDGVTVAVLGGGISRLYPSENKKLADRITQKGAVISEYPMEMEPCRNFFPVRNRIISGLSQGVLVVEAKAKSGALITAQLALEEGRDVYAVPGNADSARSDGTNLLLKQGAKLVTSAEDILEELNIASKPLSQDSITIPSKVHALSAAEKKILSLIESDALHVDDLIEESGLEASKAMSALSMLEIKGLATQLPGKQFIKK